MGDDEYYDALKAINELTKGTAHTDQAMAEIQDICISALVGVPTDDLLTKPANILELTPEIRLEIFRLAVDTQNKLQAPLGAHYKRLLDIFQGIQGGNKGQEPGEGCNHRYAMHCRKCNKPFPGSYTQSMQG